MNQPNIDRDPVSNEESVTQQNDQVKQDERVKQDEGLNKYIEGFLNPDCDIAKELKERLSEDEIRKFVIDAFYTLYGGEEWVAPMWLDEHTAIEFVESIDEIHPSYSMQEDTELFYNFKTEKAPLSALMGRFYKPKHGKLPKWTNDSRILE